ncbi:MAG: hypothetical protein MJD61_13480 [Proteobacteria bacterium]|nr:hypothetical protein [Pseudomonadota bacterium]
MVSQPKRAASDVERVLRAHWGPSVAWLAGQLGDVELAEACVREALALALERCEQNGMPARPLEWMQAAARRRAVLRLRQRAQGCAYPEQPEDSLTGAATSGPQEQGLRDDLLALLFLCTHPALSPAAAIARILHTVRGLDEEALASALQLEPGVVQQRLVEARLAVSQLDVAFRPPDVRAIAQWLDRHLGLLHAIFAEGDCASHGDWAASDALCDEALELVSLLVRLLPAEPDVLGLASLMRFTIARRAARYSAQGLMIPVEAQNRAMWDGGQVTEAASLLERALRQRRPGRYQLLAAIAATHAQARTGAKTNWGRIVHLYDLLLFWDPAPKIELERAVAVGKHQGPQWGLAIVDNIRRSNDLEHSYQLHAARGELLDKWGKHAAARDAYLQASDLCANLTERRSFLGHTAST